ncbi:MAG TPA: xanthine dehydrogenase family protein subunit M [Bryobacteraceae bacterium]|nr:xanthine dehydrogenase family protein subunit M [Bryobacteraceae bacterium]
MMQRFSYQRAASVREAAASSARPGARILAGGTDLLGCLRDEIFTASTVVSLSGIKELKGIGARSGGGLRIGAMTTLTEVAESKEVLTGYPVLAQAALAAASPQLRNQGTIGGNICQRSRCWYYRGRFNCLRKGGDTCYAAGGENEFHCIFGGAPCFMVHPSDIAPALMALDARATIVGSRGTRTIPISSFYVLPEKSVTNETVLAPGDVVTEILLPAPAAGAKSMYRKVRVRGAFDFATVGAAINLTVSGGKVGSARIVLSGVAPVPWRSAEAEKALAGNSLDAATATAAGEAAVKGASPLEKNEYKVLMVRGVLEESLAALA